MGRRIVRVPLDFNAPLGEVWTGYLTPDRFQENPCPDCENGYSPQAQHLYSLWYGHLPFDPASTGSTPFTADTPAVRAVAERNVSRSPDYYLGRPSINWTDPAQHEADIAAARAATLAGYDQGRIDAATAREAQRLADFFNSGWSHHLNQDDVDALIAEGRLHDFTHTWTRGDGWQPIDPPVVPTAAQVNEWSLSGFGHDSINAHIAIRARCAREGMPVECATCGGHGSLEAYAGQRAEAEAWQPTEPPAGDGWQLWETVSEGSPISPVFDTSEGLVAWMSDPERGRDWVPGEVAAKFVADGWAPTGVVTSTDVMSGVEFVGTRED
ncbi:hypothetical protein QQG74_09410 [Micromonospora sp. FIMYZ51]|uniref:hypothetical protein n=1 Tax=Micromonospora sp. FIMYZ51 TaxID=3051832 RepID=UPI00311E4CB9